MLPKKTPSDIRLRFRFLHDRPNGVSSCSVDELPKVSLSHKRWTGEFIRGSPLIKSLLEGDQTLNTIRGKLAGVVGKNQQLSDFCRRNGDDSAFASSTEFGIVVKGCSQEPVHFSATCCQGPHREIDQGKGFELRHKKKFSAPLRAYSAEKTDIISKLPPTINLETWTKDVRESPLALQFLLANGRTEKNIKEWLYRVMGEKKVVAPARRQ